ncbi:hypothetical protein P8452_67368 [Trifolium repens]|nr:hypothetical protein P8452_67368 [Trifolium repens]
MPKGQETQVDHTEVVIVADYIDQSAVHEINNVSPHKSDIDESIVQEPILAKSVSVSDETVKDFELVREPRHEAELDARLIPILELVKEA